MQYLGGTQTTPAMRLPYALTTAAIFFMWHPQDASAQWEQVGEPGAAYGVALHGDLLFAGMQNDSIYVSADQGDTWTTANTGITNASNWWLASVGGNLYCGTQSGPLFRSVDDGSNWEDIGLSGVRGLEEHNDTLYACTWYTHAVYWSVDAGDTWTATAPLNGSGGLWPMLSFHGYLFVGGQGGGVFRIEHTGDTWQAMNNGLGNLNAYAFTTLGDIIYVGTTAGVWRTADDGATWESTGMTGGIVYSLLAVDTLLFSGGDSGISLSTDSGATWTAINEGLTSSSIARLVHDAEYIYAGGYAGSGVHRRLLNEDNVGLNEASPVLERPMVYPIPARDQVRIMWPRHSGLSYRIIDLAGQIAAVSAGMQGSIDVSALYAGPYLLELRDGQGERAVLRLMKE